MASVSEWLKDKEPWVGDALRRLATKDELNDADQDEIYDRLKKQHGLIEEELVCKALEEANLNDPAAQVERVLLRGIGPLINVDRLSGDQELVFAKNGITLIFGENASGKSGYARAARRICNARVDDPLRGNVFADTPPEPAEVHYRYDLGAAENKKEVWREGDPKPNVLSPITILDTENARVYIERENEILFVPRRIRLLTKLGSLFEALAGRVQMDTSKIDKACPHPYGMAYGSDTPAGLHVKLLICDTAPNNLPSEAKFKELGSWSDKEEGEFSELQVAMTQTPSARALRLRRLSEALGSSITPLKELETNLTDEFVGELEKKLLERQATADAVALFGSQKMEGLPIPGTGSPGWRLLYEHARRFASEVGLRPLQESFQEGDPCPLCQTPLDEAAASRLKDFDTFVGGEINAAAKSASTDVENLRISLLALNSRSSEEVTQALSEYAAIGASEAAQVENLANYSTALNDRRDALVAAIDSSTMAKLSQLPESPVASLTTVSSDLAEKATHLESQQKDDAGAKKLRELSDQKLLHSQLPEVLQRRALLGERAKLVACASSLNTAAISRFVSNLRGDLVTPALEKRIKAEVKALKLDHIPLKFHEASAKGKSIFDVALDAMGKPKKGKVLSEGEQRALSLACFLAESHVVASKDALIVDDPVTSMDHERLRRVAKRLVLEAANRSQIIIFTHNLLFYQEILRSAVEVSPPVPVLQNYIYKESDDKFGVVAIDDEPWITKKVKDRIKIVADKLVNIPDTLSTSTEEYRALSKAFYTDLRECWERMVEEIILNKVVERFSSEVKTQSLRGVSVDDEDYKAIYFNMMRVSEFSGHDLASAKQVSYPDKAEMQKDLDTFEEFLGTSVTKRNNIQKKREALLVPPPAAY